jgi:hypothetical protein
MQSIKIVVFKNILKNEYSEECITMFKTIDIPFPPFSGMKIRAGTTELTSSELIWVTDVNQFRCNLDPEYESNTFTIEQLISIHEDGGWKLLSQQLDKTIFRS